MSLVTGRGCANALREEGFDVVEIDPQDDLPIKLTAASPDAVFNALHGRWGEDGCVQGLLELLRIPYTHSGVLASALAMHKQHAKDIFRAAGLPSRQQHCGYRSASSQRAAPHGATLRRKAGEREGDPASAYLSFGKGTTVRLRNWGVKPGRFPMR